MRGILASRESLLVLGQGGGVVRVRAARMIRGCSMLVVRVGVERRRVARTSDRISALKAQENFTRTGIRSNLGAPNPAQISGVPLQTPALHFLILGILTVYLDGVLCHVA